MNTEAPLFSALIIIFGRRPGDLDASIVEVGSAGATRHRVAALDRVRQEVGGLPGVESRLAAGAIGQQSLALGSKDRCSCATKSSASGSTPPRGAGRRS
jgi:hypothetical protein